MPAQKIFRIRKLLSRDDRGTSLTEFAIVIPLLYVFLAGLVDVSDMVVTYMSLSEVVGEATRSLSAAPGLQSQSVYWSGLDPNISGSSEISPATMTACTQNPSLGSLPCGHAIAHQRVRSLLEIFLKMKNVDMTSLTVETEYFETPIGANPSDTVWLRVSVDYAGMFPPFRNFRISAEGQGVYLF